MSLQLITFIILAIIGLASAIMLVIQKNPVYSALLLIMHFFALAGFYLLLNAQFLAVLQILVYAGAIMVLFVFVIMLLNLQNEEALKDPFNLRKIIATILGVVLFLQFGVFFFIKAKNDLDIIPSKNSVEAGSIKNIGELLFSTYLVPFEITSFVLLVGIIAAIVLAKRKFE
ncbi:MAG: NADH-quinone oxidoreductase subunit J [Ignavibacteria bacterium]|jgi:NADH-quinone oxidoreductase subunit J|nr:NADH-quinone oxidoreductase subunit J [Ignavibacteria bacterium]MDH7527569.1 NADH-quinone oxidoreductase subunit J [Ignavibacteria bacterium]NPV12261.1 NADH-quinone oxidoreductase subunit J [Ignavibacteria bacterium]